MLDNNSKIVLEFLVSECEIGKFKNIEICDVQTFLADNKLSDEQIKKILIKLEENNFITIKYKSDDVFCLTIMPYAKTIFEKEYIEKNNQIKYKKIAKKIIFLVSFFAFLGSFLGTIFYNIILLFFNN